MIIEGGFTLKAPIEKLFDFVLKRHLAVNGTRLSAAVFETRGFFVR